jgi:hypothetical protein
MDNKNNTAPTKAEPIFKHRFDINQADNIGHVTDSIGLITDKARGALFMLFGHFDGENRYNNQLIQGAIDAVISEIDDIDCIIQAHSEAVRAAKKGGAI